MSLAQRLLLGALLIVSVLVLVAVAISTQRLGGQLRELKTDQLAREARFVAQQWAPGVEADQLADSAGAALGHRVTLVDSSGRVIGDSQFDEAGMALLQNHNTRPEIVEARRSGTGSAKRQSPSEGDEELYVAVRARAGGIARVSIGTRELSAIVTQARNDVLFSGIVALIVVLAIAALFARQVSRPVVELRDVATAIAGGDLRRRPALSAPAEVGELASAVHRMAEQLETRMQRAEEEELLLVALVESLNEGVIAVDAQRRVIRINRSGREVLGVSADTPFPADLLPRDRALVDALADALAGRAVEGAETTIGNRTLALTARPLDKGGAVLAVFDLTGLRRLQTVRRDFVANVSHELKTPLTAIRGFAETLATELAADEQQARFAETIRANAERMQRLVDDLLDLSRIESGGWTPCPVSVNLVSAAQDVAASLRAAMESRGVAFALDLADVSSAWVDPMALSQALANLIENAVRYTPAGGTVTVFARRERETVAIGVRDTGSGIPSEHLPRVFERFYRVDAARSRAAGGTGLGLAIVKHLVEAHGGSVTAASIVGQGTTITMRFPSRG